ncbi:MAG: MBL fold metallo-hydrolase [Planctomycetota bacterium]|nr:MBL fold metallo-hydrolase [Planctomycetota bacterium]
MATPSSIHIVCAGGYLQCTTYLIDGPEGAVLVDPGSSSGEEEILKNIARLGRKIEDVKYALLTHCHVDHALGAYRFREMGMKLVSSRYTARVLRDGGREVWYEYPEWVVPTQVDIVANNEDDLPFCGLHILALDTRGHTPGCMSYLVGVEGGTAVFTGDLYGAGGHLSWSGSDGFSVKSTLRSLEKLCRASPDWVFTGHGPVPVPAAEWLSEAVRKGRAGEWVVDGRFHPNDVPDSRLRVVPPQQRR